MMILHDILTKLKAEFCQSQKGQQRATWPIYTLVAIIIPFGSAKTSNLYRCLQIFFGLTAMTKKQYYRFMASPLILWDKLWPRLWKMIPEPLTKQRLIIAIDDCINPKTGRKIFACDKFFDHAAKLNQSKYPWAQNIVTIGLLKMVKGRWACLPLDYRFYHPKKNIEKVRSRLKGKPIEFETRLDQAATMIAGVADQIKALVLAVADSWFGNNGLWAPLQNQLDQRFDLLSRMRSNQNLFDFPAAPDKTRPGRPKKYGRKLGNTSSLAAAFKARARQYEVNLYGRLRALMAYDQVVMLKTFMKKLRSAGMPLMAGTILPSQTCDGLWPGPHWTIILQYFARRHANH